MGLFCLPRIKQGGKKGPEKSVKQPEMWPRQRELQANGLSHTVESHKVCCTAGKGEAGTGTESSQGQGKEQLESFSELKGRARPHLILLDIVLLKVSSARFKGKAKPHLHIKSCLTLGPRAGGLTLLFCIDVPGLAMPSVCTDWKQKAKPWLERGFGICSHPSWPIASSITVLGREVILILPLLMLRLKYWMGTEKSWVNFLALSKSSLEVLAKSFNLCASHPYHLTILYLTGLLWNAAH